LADAFQQYIEINESLRDEINIRKMLLVEAQDNIDASQDLIDEKLRETISYWDQTQQLYQAVENYKIQTGLDRQSTASDREIVAADRIQTGLDRIQTGVDAQSTAADRIQTGLDVQLIIGDKIQTGLDRQATAADRIQVEIYANDSQQSANNAELYKTQSYQYSQDSLNQKNIAISVLEETKRVRDDAVRITTGGSASLTSAPGMIPIANSSGKIDINWLPSFIGTFPNQVPTNSLLGELAYKSVASVDLPLSSSSDGMKGQISVDSEYLYVCVGSNMWKRIPLQDWT
jgi:hypothetical protein